MKLGSTDSSNTLHSLFFSLQRMLPPMLGIPECLVLNPGYLQGCSHSKEQASFQCSGGWMERALQLSPPPPPDLLSKDKLLSGGTLQHQNHYPPIPTGSKSLHPGIQELLKLVSGRQPVNTTFEHLEAINAEVLSSPSKSNR